MILVLWRPQEWLVRWLFGWPLLNVIVAFALFAFIIERDTGRLKIEKRLPQYFLLLGLWVGTVMSHIANTYFQGMLDTIPDSFKICFFTALLITVLDRPRKFQVTAIIFVSMACVMAIHAILQDERGYGFAGLRPMWVPSQRLGEPGRFRSLFFGTFSDPNDLAQILVTAMPFSFVVFKKRSIFGFAFACFFVWLLYKGFATTHSRGGLVGLAATSVVMIINIMPSRWFPTLSLIAGGGALLLCTFAGAVLDQSSQERVVFWGLANDVFKRKPLFGIGYGMFWQVTSQSRAAHNMFVGCYTELGFFGYMFWFGLLVLGFIGTWRTRVALVGARGEDAVFLRRFSGHLLASTFGFIASGYFLSRTFIYPIFFLMAMMAALPVVALKYLPENHKFFLSRKDLVFWVPAGAAMSIIYIYFSILILNKAFYG